ncbi:MAG: endonuclease/exonuclease/phosphatase family protein [Planctomycetes bacterium]|nr:endonuclease/exonuclease/phosphatase family protein [Planctomycetota bacterium]
MARKTRSAPSLFGLVFKAIVPRLNARAHGLTQASLAALGLTVSAIALAIGCCMPMADAAGPSIGDTLSERLVAIPIAGEIASPPLVAISQAPVASGGYRALPSPASPALVPISYAPASHAASRAAPLPATLPLSPISSSQLVAPIVQSPMAIRNGGNSTAIKPPPSRIATIAPVPSPASIAAARPAFAPTPPPPLPAPLPVAHTPASQPITPPPIATAPGGVPATRDHFPPPQVALSQPTPSAAVAPALSSPAPPASAPPAPAPPSAAPIQGKSLDAITIASFNIQVFGESKMAKPQVVDVLARVVRTFDIVAIQEIRAKSDQIIPEFVRRVNADGSRYQFVIGPRLGRTASKEQYVFIYDTNRIELDPTSVGTLPDPSDRLHRPPLHARFRVRANPPELGFSFWLVDTHTDPDEVPQEVDALADVFLAMKSLRPDEDDVILLGDLNAAPVQFGRIKQIPAITWAVSGVPTNTRRSKTYDNLIFDQIATSEYTGRWGVVDLQNTFGLSIDKALEVSDHNPVWAAFRPWETQRTAGASVPPALNR